MLRITFLILIIAISFEASGQDYFFRQYTNEEGLHHSFIYSINQDSDGFIWLGTGEGLYRFNGFDFEYFTIDDGLADNFVTKIFRDKSGKLWIGHQSGSVSVLSGNDFVVLNESSEIYGSVTDITQDDQGFIWATVQNQGLLLVKENFAITPVIFSNDEPLSQIEYLGNDHFLIGSQGNIYLSKYERASGSMVILNRFEDYPGSKVVEIVQESPGNYLVVSQDDGFYWFEFDRLSAEYTFSTIDDNADGVLDNLQGGIIDGKGILWLNSMGNGLIKYRRAGLTRAATAY
jgi:ligand-binding sensor domain-containing protein